jgi:hypothetical protein
MVGNWGEGADRPSPAEILIVGHSFIRRAKEHAEAHREACAPLTHDAIFSIGMGGATLPQILDKAWEALPFHPAVHLIVIHGGENELDRDRPGSPCPDYERVLQEIQEAISGFVLGLPTGCKVLFVLPADRFRWPPNNKCQGAAHTAYLARIAELGKIFQRASEMHPDRVLVGQRNRDLHLMKHFGPDGIHLNGDAIHHYCCYLLRIIRPLVSTVNLALPRGH